MEGSLIIFNTGVKVLFDTGASHSFISAACAMSLGLKPKRLEVPISTGTPMGSNVYLNRYYTAIISLHSECHMKDNFIVMDMSPYDVSLGMDWLTKYQATINSYIKKVAISHQMIIKVLFNTGASHSFISVACAMSLGLKLKRLEFPISIGTPTGSNVSLNRYCTAIVSLHSDCHMEDNFILIDISPYDLILGMDWLTKYQAMIDCHAKKVTFPTCGES